MEGPTKEQREFDRLCDEHRKRFNKGYGINFADERPLSTHIEILKEALRTGVPAEPMNLEQSLGTGIIV